VEHCCSVTRSSPTFSTTSRAMRCCQPPREPGSLGGERPRKLRVQANFNGAPVTGVQKREVKIPLEIQEHAVEGGRGGGARRSARR
jgi:hypothetical protein